MSKIVWGKEMTDEEFVEVSKPYFAREGEWDLHEGICLFSKIDPVKKQRIVGTDTKNEDQTNRPYKYALEAIATSKGLKGALNEDLALLVIDVDPDMEGAQRYQVNPRGFIVWATTRWPDSSSHLALAESTYKEQKLLSGGTCSDAANIFANMSREKKVKVTKSAFFEIAKERGFDFKKPRGNVRGWATQLSSYMKPKVGKPYGFEEIRKMIPEWL